MINLHFNISLWIFSVDVDVNLSYAVVGLLVVIAIILLLPVIKTLGG